MTIVCQDGELGQGCEGHHEHGIPFIWDLYEPGQCHEDQPQD